MIETAAETSQGRSPLPRPLTGVTVLDLTIALAGPFATLLLAGLGAQVIKVENPAGGDQARNNAPYLGVQGAKLVRERDDDVSVSVLNRLRNKLSITLNLKHPRSREIFGRLVKSSDVVAENFSRGTMDRLGLGYSFVRDNNPRAVYCALTGFGSDDDAGSSKAMDTIIQALSGVMHTSGDADDPPIRMGVPFADLITPLYSVIGILAALRQAELTGVGQFVDVSMLGVMTSLVASEPFDVLERLGIPLKTGQTVARLAPFGVYRALDGYVALCAPTETFAQKLFQAMGRPELASDERFSTRDMRVKHVRELDALVESWMSPIPLKELLARLDSAGVPAAEVREPKDAVMDPHVIKRGETVRLAHPKYGLVGEVYGTGVPIKFSASEVGFDQPPPELGEHNDLVYGKILGYSPSEIDELRVEGVI